MQISNAATGAVLSTETLSSFYSGVYLQWAVSGNVLITITKLSGPNAVLSGLFFDQQSTAAAVFATTDTTTEGNWIGAYGGQGYDVLGDTASIPSFATVTPHGEIPYTWAASTTDTRALQNPGGSGRIAACWYSTPSFTIDVNMTDGLTHYLGLYFVDWDNSGRSERVQISNDVTGAVLSTETVSSFYSGVYLEWAVSGNVLITITKLSGTNAVISGLFFDGGSDSDGALIEESVPMAAPATTAGLAVAGTPMPDRLSPMTSAGRGAAIFRGGDVRSLGTPAIGRRCGCDGDSTSWRGRPRRPHRSMRSPR